MLRSKETMLEKRIEKLEKALEMALCEHDQTWINYFKVHGDNSANPEYTKECGLCGKQFQNVLASQMHAEIAREKRKEADRAERASTYYKADWVDQP